MKWRELTMGLVANAEVAYFNPPAVAGNQAITGVNFQPNLFLFVGGLVMILADGRFRCGYRGSVSAAKEIDALVVE